MYEIPDWIKEANASYLEVLYNKDVIEDMRSRWMK